ncbi:MAG: hypothetical protein WEB06_01460 [Actinomycetota bacterium]
MQSTTYRRLMVTAVLAAIIVIALLVSGSFGAADTSQFLDELGSYVGPYAG